jgi:hypothetical protein
MAEPYDPTADAEAVLAYWRTWQGDDEDLPDWQRAALRLARWAAGDDGPVEGPWLESVGIPRLGSNWPNWQQHYDGGRALTLWQDGRGEWRWQYGDTPLPDNPERRHVAALLAALGAAPAGESRPTEE